MDESDGLQSIGSQRVGQDWSNSSHTRKGHYWPLSCSSQKLKNIWINFISKSCQFSLQNTKIHAEYISFPPSPALPPWFKPPLPLSQITAITSKLNFLELILHRQTELLNVIYMCSNPSSDFLLHPGRKNPNFPPLPTTLVNAFPLLPIPCKLFFSYKSLLSISGIPSSSYPRAIAHFVASGSKFSHPIPTPFPFIHFKNSKKWRICPDRKWQNSVKQLSLIKK